MERALNWDELHPWERAELGRALRRLGWTYSEIRELIPVPKGTLSYWCREIRLTPEQVEAIKRRRPPGVRGRVPVDTQRKRKEEIERIKAEARAFALDHLSDLYWAEGLKSHRHLEVANSDPAALRLFIRWVRYFHASNAEFVLALHLHEGNDEHHAKAHWRRELDLPDADFHKTFIKPRGTGHRKNQLEFGVCRVRMRRGTDSWRRTLTWTEVLADLDS